jgi:hypothetical protein
MMIYAFSGAKVVKIIQTIIKKSLFLQFFTPSVGV